MDHQQTAEPAAHPATQAEAHHGNGLTAFEAGDLAEAVLAGSGAVEFSPQDVEAHIKLGLALAPAFAQAQGVLELPEVASVRPPRIEVRDTRSARGRGVFAMQDFAEGELVESCPVLIFQEPFDSLPAEVKTVAFNWGVLCGVGSAHALALGYGSLYNHANPAALRYVPDPENLALVMFATREVKAGEELTINYNAPSGMESVDDGLWFGRMNIAQIL